MVLAAGLGSIGEGQQKLGRVGIGCQDAPAKLIGFRGAAVIYANTDSVFVLLPGRTPQQAVREGKAMAEYVSSHPSLPATLTLEYERVLAPCLLDGHNRYAGGEYVSGQEPTASLHQS